MTFLTTENFPERAVLGSEIGMASPQISPGLPAIWPARMSSRSVSSTRGPSSPGANCSTGTEGGACSPGIGRFRLQAIWVSWTDEDGSLLFALPFSMSEATTAGEQNYTGDLYTAFLQDSWRVLPNLTLKVGFRYDQVSYDNNVGRQVADMNKFQPRVGVRLGPSQTTRRTSFEGTGDASWDPASLTLPSILRAGNEPSFEMVCRASTRRPTPWGSLTHPSASSSLASFFGFPYRADDPDGMDPYGWFLLPGSITGVLGETLVQPDLRAIVLRYS